MAGETKRLTGRLFRNALDLKQDAAGLDLYGTVDAGFCSLEAMNYLSPEDAEGLIRRLRFFIRPGGLFLFDMRSPDFLRSLDGGTFVDEDEDLLCLWRSDFDEEAGALVHGMDIFSREGGLWRREREEHIEYAHEPERLARLLRDWGFEEPQLRLEDERIHVVARRREENGAGL